MKLNFKSSSHENLLAEVLEQFDKQDKDELASKLVKKLNLRRFGKRYATQVRMKLDRELTRDEEFKLNILDRTHNYSSGGNGDGSQED